ncbi:hypothetical protein [Sulfurimonas sp.]|uniref:hypothetical protein n=1 Tax=Sulfurimonas sp. TaxID=2022749 RepID=UPI002B4A19A1|nr:hypothetical protein [Sulfurimonas sp.]
MTAIVTLLPIFGFAALFNVFLKKSVSVSIFFSITSIITILFTFGMFEFLQIGAYLLFYGGIFLAILMGTMYKNELFKSIKSVPFVIYTLMSIIYLYLMKDAQFFFWDEYSHWGAFIKEMSYFHQFYDLNSIASNRMYPPGISVWDYFLVLPTGFSEGKIYFAYFLILFSSVLMMYERLKWKQSYWIALIFVMQMIVFATYGHWFSSIYVDHVVGALVAGIILSYFVDEFNGRELFLLAIPLVTLVLLKEVGLYFGVVFLGMVFLLKIYESNGSLLLRLKEQIKTVFILMSLLLLMLSVLKIWEVRQESTGLKTPSHSMSTLVRNIISGKKLYNDKKAQEKYNEVFTNVILNQQLHTEKVSLNYNEFTYGTMSKFTKELKLSTVGTYIFILCSIFLLVLMTRDRKEKYKVLIITMYLFFTSLLYLLILYLSMPLSFGNRALNMVSFIRYINISIMPILFVVFAFYLPLFKYEIKTKNNDILKKFIALLSIVLVFSFITRPYFKPLYSQLENSFRKQIDGVAPRLLEHIPYKAKLLVVFPVRNNGSLNIIIKYALIPSKSTVTAFDFFEKKSIQEVLAEYEKYDYIWFASLNQIVINKSQKILRQKNEKNIFTLYKAEILNKKIVFKPVM